MKPTTLETETQKDAGVLRASAAIARELQVMDSHLDQLQSALAGALSGLPLPPTEKLASRRTIQLNGRAAYVARPRPGRQGIPRFEQGVPLEAALEAAVEGKRFSAAPHLYVHKVHSDEVVISEEPVTLADRAAGRDPVKHLDLVSDDLPIAFCAGELHVLHAKAPSVMVAVVTNKSGSFVPEGAALRAFAAQLLHRYGFTAAIAADYENRTVTVHRPRET